MLLNGEFEGDFMQNAHSQLNPLLTKCPQDYQAAVERLISTLMAVFNVSKQSRYSLGEFGRRFKAHFFGGCDGTLKQDQAEKNRKEAVALLNDEVLIPEFDAAYRTYIVVANKYIKVTLK